MNKQTPAKIIAVANRKGGCAKTATAVNLGAALANEEFKVLVIDLDSQANLTTHLGSGLGKFTLTSSDFLTGSINGSKKIRYRDVAIIHGNHKGFLQVMPSNDTLFDAENLLQAMKINGNDRPYGYLRRSIQTIDEDLDYIIIDTPPGEGLILRNALAAAQFVLMPGKTDPGSIDGFKRIVRIVQKEIMPVNPHLRLLGILGTMFNPITHLAKAFVEHVDKQYPNALFNTRIRQDIKLPEAHLKGMSIFEYQPYCNAAHDYTQLMYEVVVKTGRKGQRS